MIVNFRDFTCTHSGCVLSVAPICREWIVVLDMEGKDFESCLFLHLVIWKEYNIEVMN